jgi:hypothetical protein
MHTTHTWSSRQRGRGLMAIGPQCTKVCTFYYFTWSFIFFLGIKIEYLLKIIDNSVLKAAHFFCFKQEVVLLVEAYPLSFYFFGNWSIFAGNSYQFFGVQTY